jgi:serine protease Do
VRSGPGTDFERIATALRGQTLPISDEENNCAWVRIQTPDGIEGWISGATQFVTLSGPCDTAGQPTSVDAPATEPTPTRPPAQVLPLATQTPLTDTVQSTPTPSPAAPTETAETETTEGAIDPLPPDMGCYLFQNQLGPALTVTITSSDGSNQDFEMPGGSEVTYCFPPGTYTYTVDAPLPWADLNGDLTVRAGEHFLFPVHAQE